MMHRGPSKRKRAAVLALAVGMVAGCPSRFDPRAEPLSAAASPDPSAQRAYHDAKARLDAGDATTAEAGFSEFGRRYPTDPLAPQAALWRARADLALGGDGTARAVALAEPLAARPAGDPIGERARFVLGLALARGSDGDSALRALALLRPFAPQIVGGDDAVELHAALAAAATRAHLPAEALAELGAFFDGARPVERAYVRAEAERIAQALPEAEASALVRDAPAGSLAAATVGARLAALRRAAGDAAGAARLAAEAAPARARFGLDAATDGTAGTDGQGGEPAGPPAVGLVLPLSGKNRLLGERALRGALLAADVLPVPAGPSPGDAASSSSVTGPPAPAMSGSASRSGSDAPAASPSFTVAVPSRSGSAAQAGSPSSTGAAGSAWGSSTVGGAPSSVAASSTSASSSTSGVPALRLLVRDDQSSPERAAAAVDELARLGVVAIVVSPERGEAAAAVSRAAALGVPCLELAPDEQRAAGPIFKLVRPNADRATALAGRALAAGARRVALLYPETPYARRMADIFAAAARAGGATVVATVAYEERATTFIKPVKQVADAHPDAVFLPAPSAQLELVAAQLYAAGVTRGERRPRAGAAHNQGALLLATADGAGPRLLASAGRYLQGALLAPVYFAEGGAGTVDGRGGAFLDRFRDQFFEEPATAEALAYDAVRAVRRALDATPAPPASAAARRGVVAERLLAPSTGPAHPSAPSGLPSTAPAASSPPASSPERGVTGPLSFLPGGERAGAPTVYTAEGDVIHAVP